MTTLLKNIPTFLVIVLLISSCSDKASKEVDNNLLHVNAYDTLAQISFPNYLSLDTNYTWDDYSDCPCCGRLKTRFQNKKDSSQKEAGFLHLNHFPKLKTYLTFMFPRSINCYLHEIKKTEYNYPDEKSISRVMLEDELSYYKTKNIYEFSYLNAKKQAVSVSMLCTYLRHKNMLYASIFVATFNKKNKFRIRIKFERSHETSISEFVINTMKTIHEMEVE